MKRTIVFCFCLSTVAFTASIASAQQEKVFVPSARLVFRALDSLSKSKVTWKGLSSYNRTSTYNSRFMIALNLGSRVSDAFVASQAKDDEKFVQMALTMGELATKLGAEIDPATNQQMLELVKAGNWNEVRAMLDKQQDETKRKLNRLDKDASVLVVVGGWLEGLHITTKALSVNYNESASSIIASPKLLDYLIGEIENISVAARNHPIIRKLAPALLEIKNLVNVEKGKPVPHENIKRIYVITSGLIKEIESSKD
ncbi:MAG: hypothetical protein RML40_10355 [Bacteroidota bacterium]|nr:hypothetical protein [Bacteroidota bacterium]